MPCHVMLHLWSSCVKLLPSAGYCQWTATVFFGCDTFGSSGPFPKMAQVKTRMCRFRREWINLLCLTLWICLFRLKLIVLKTTLIVLWG